MRIGVSLSMVVAALLSAGNLWGAQVQVTTDKPVYKSGASGKVYFTVKNTGSEMVRFQNTYWMILNGGTIFASAAGPYFELPPGASMTWNWNKKYGTGTFAPAGTYYLWVNMTVGIMNKSSYRWFSLTPTGRIAGTNRFPLSVGDNWQYTINDSNQTTYQYTYQQDGNWFRVSNLLDTLRWVQRTGTTLYTKPDTTGAVGPLFRFSRPLGFTYSVAVGSLNGLLKVGATSETVETPAGKFTGCYRLDVVSPNASLNGYLSFWFHAGTGLVQVARQDAGQLQMLKLQYAKIRGSDGQDYRLGFVK